MLISKEVDVTLVTSSAKYYESIGYEIPKKKNKKGKIVIPRGAKITVKIEDLQPKSNVEVVVKCDYCGEVFKRRYADHTFIHSKDNGVNTDACEDCAILKFKEAYSLKHGVDNPFYEENIKDKIKETNNIKYGSNTPMSSEVVKSKIRATCMDKYGVDNPSKSEEVKQKIVDTIHERYGVDNIMDLEEYRLKIAETLSKNNTVNTSKQQIYLHKLLGGILNYSKETPVLDIAYPNDKIYLEYNGGGHNLRVKLGIETEEQFRNKELRRYHYLKDKGWKAIFIDSEQDYLPEDNVIINMLNTAKDYLTDDCKWVKFKIDESKIIHNSISEEFNFGKLRKIKDNDLQVVS